MGVAAAPLSDVIWYEIGRARGSQVMRLLCVLTRRDELVPVEPVDQHALEVTVAGSRHPDTGQPAIC